MKYLHTMVRVTDLDASLDFYCEKLGLKEIHRIDVESGRFTLVFLAAPGDESAQVELTYNWDPEPYGSGRNFGHLAYGVDEHLRDLSTPDGCRSHHQPPAPRWSHGVHPLAGQHFDRAAPDEWCTSRTGALAIDAERGRVVASPRPAN